jgi:hypothetical protein
VRVHDQMRQLRSFGALRSGRKNSRKAVGEHDRQWGRSVAAFVHEMDPPAVDVGAVVREKVELPFLFAPIKLVSPCRNQ